MKYFQKTVSILLLLGLLCSLAACSKKPEGPTPTTTPTTTTATNPASPQWAAYDASQDAPFLPKDIYTKELFAPGITLGQTGEYTLDVTDKAGQGAFVFAGEFGKCYEIKIPAGVPCAAAARFTTDPRTYEVGKHLTYDSTTSVKKITKNPDITVSFMYTCRNKGEYLVIYTGTDAPVYIGERTIIQDKDTTGPWYIPEPVGDIVTTKKLGNFAWNSEQFVDNMYEPVRSRYPEYITRENIGKDETGKYDMYCYVYTPKDYKTTLFLNGGTHGDEEVGYFALAKCMQLIADAKPEDTILYTLRQNVRFVVIPIVNVYSVSNTHTRTNGKGEDLNRNYDDLSQQESKNVIACFEKYVKDIAVAMDFHIANASPDNVAVYFNFINYSDNAVVNYKTTNHMFQRYLELGYAVPYTDLARVPGSYTKSDAYFEGRIWNKYRVPTITIEYLTTTNFPAEFSNKCMTLAVETYINFIIQNGLFYIQDK